MQEIRIKDLEPVPLRGLFSDSGIWKTEVSFQKGEHTLVKAPSGRGKSTFIHMLIGIRQDYTGQIEYDGQATQSFDYEKWAQIRSKHCSVVYQDLRLLLNLTVSDNLNLKNALSKIKTEDEILKMVERLDMGSFWDTKMETMSYGQRQRIAIVRALCQPFDFLVLDEPFSHLDPDNQNRSIELILEACKKQGAGLILCSHESDYGISFDQELSL